MTKRILLAGWVLAAVLFMVSCEKSTDNDTVTEQEEAFDYTQILTDYVSNTVLPTYAEMKDNAKMLLAKVQSFETSGSQDDLDAAAEYWKATRAPWEMGEAFLFGPAAFNNLDPLLDSWPLDRSQLDQVLAGSQELSVDYVRDGLGAVLRGFHTVEYLLFRDGAVRTAADVTPREKAYLTAVSHVLRDDCISLWAQWDGGAAEQAILDELGLEIGTPYAEEFKKAGQAGSRYVSQLDAVDEILQGMIGIADEVANGKIADPHTSGEVLDVESWFSWNSQIDFQNNMRSIQNSYLGSYGQSTPASSISTYIKSKDQAIDAKMKAAITTAIDAIAAIPYPFRNNLQDATVQTAMDACNALMEVLDSEVRPLIVN